MRSGLVRAATGSRLDNTHLQPCPHSDWSLHRHQMFGHRICDTLKMPQKSLQGQRQCCSPRKLSCLLCVFTGVDAMLLLAEVLCGHCKCTLACCFWLLKSGFTDARGQRPSRTLLSCILHRVGRRCTMCPCLLLPSSCHRTR